MVANFTVHKSCTRLLVILWYFLFCLCISQEIQHDESIYFEIKNKIDGINDLDPKSSTVLMYAAAAGGPFSLDQFDLMDFNSQ